MVIVSKSSRGNWFSLFSANFDHKEEGMNICFIRRISNTISITMSRGLRTYLILVRIFINEIYIEFLRNNLEMYRMRCFAYYRGLETIVRSSSSIYL